MGTTSNKTRSGASSKAARRLAATLAVVGLLAALGANAASAEVLQVADAPAYGVDASWYS